MYYFGIVKIDRFIDVNMRVHISTVADPEISKSGGPLQKRPPPPYIAKKSRILGLKS
jgi:hypothetical protein